MVEHRNSYECWQNKGQNTGRTLYANENLWTETEKAFLFGGWRKHCYVLTKPNNNEHFVRTGINLQLNYQTYWNVIYIQWFISEKNSDTIELLKSAAVTDGGGVRAGGALVLMKEQDSVCKYCIAGKLSCQMVNEVQSQIHSFSGWF